MRSLPLIAFVLGLFSMPPSAAAEGDLRVLFVGNSYSFQVPKVFAQIAKSKGKEVHVEQVTKGGWTLAKHAAAEATRTKISGAEWDVVVLQEQSQIPSFPDAQKRMGPAVEALGGLAKDSGSKLVFFETWGRRDGDVRNRKGDTFAAMQKRLSAGYATAAKQGGGEVVPVGQVWASVKRDELWSKDGSHPSKVGTYLAACVFYAALFGESPEGAGFVSGLETGVAAGLQKAAGKVAKP